MKNLGARSDWVGGTSVAFGLTKKPKLLPRDMFWELKTYHSFDLPSVMWAKRMQKFEVKFGLYLSSE